MRLSVCKYKINKINKFNDLVLDWVSSKWVPFQVRICFSATVLIAVSYDWAPPLLGETVLGTNVTL